MSRLALPLLLTTLLAGCSPVAHAAPSPAPSVTAEVDGLVGVTTTLKRGRLEVGQSMDFEVSVAPLAGSSARPVAVRARLGMPDHGHWITDEKRQEVGDAPLVFAGEYPMTGKYRVRLWIELAEGDVTTAVDFEVPGTPLQPVVFTTRPDPPPQESTGSLDAGDPAPGFDLPRLSADGSISLAGQRGRPVWIAFWASWCGPCRAELPELVTFSERWSDEVAILPVSLDTDPEMAQAFLDRLGMSLDSLIDTAGSTVDPYDARRLPLNVLIDADGQVVRRIEGYRPGLYDDADGWLAELVR